MPKEPMARVKLNAPDAKAVDQTDRSGQAEDPAGALRCSLRRLA